MKKGKTRLFLLIVLLFSAIIANQFIGSSGGDDRAMKQVRYDKPDMAQLHEFNMTRDPSLGYPPVERLVEAKKYQRSIFSRARAIQNVNWTERGPDNVAGRTRALMFDPNDPSAKKVWAAGVTGGLWYNENILSEGTKWQKINDFQGTLAVNNITFDPNNTNVFYLGTGEGWFGLGMIRGNGIWKSTDGGETWDVLPSTDQNTDFSFVQKVLVTSNSTILAAARSPFGGGGIYRSVNGGASWIKEMDGRGADIEIVGDNIYASTGISSPGRLYKSTNDGLDWTEITPAMGGERIEIGISSGSAETVYAVAGDSNGDIAWFYRSDDAGENWTELTIPAYLNQSTCEESADDFARQQSWYDLILGVHPLDSQLVVAGGIDLHRSEDGGQTWAPISYWASNCENYVHADQHNIVFRPGYPNEALFANDGGVYYTRNIKVGQEDGGPVIEMRNNNYNVTQFYSCALWNEAGSYYFLAGSQDNGSQQFRNVGMNSTFEITGGDGGFCFINQQNPAIQITSYIQNNFFITTDYWNNVVEIGSGDKGLFINPADFHDATNTLYAAGDDGMFLRYLNLEDVGNVVEEEINLGISQITAITVSPYHQDTVFLGTEDGNVHLMVNATSVEPSEAPEAFDITSNLSTGYISSIAIGTSNQHLFVTSSSYGVTSVWETMDGGQTWVNKEGNLPDMPIRWALYNPHHHEEILIATDLGVWSTDQLSDNPPEWEPTNTGLANVRCDMIKYREADGMIVVATHGRGLYTSDIFADTAYADFYIPNVVAYANEPVKFTDASVKPTTYNWVFGDGNTSTNPNPTNIYTTEGDYEVELTINNDFLSSKQIPVRVLPFIETDYLLANGGDFESSTTDFHAVTISGSGFELGSSGVVGKNGTTSGQNAWVLAPEASQYVPYSEAYLYTPAFDFSLSGDYGLEFMTQYAIEDEWDGFIMQYSLDQGNTWEKLGDFLDAENWYNQVAIDQNGIFPPGKPFFSGNTSGEFVKKSLDLSFLSGNLSVAFRFVFKSDPAAQEAGVAIDDFQLFRPDASAPVVSFSSDRSTICEDESIIFQNESTGEISGYTWDFGDGAMPQDATGYGPHEVIYTADGLKSISLIAHTADGDVEMNSDILVSRKANEVVISHGMDEACEADIMDFTIEDSQIGASYVLTDQGVALSDTILGNGFDITLNNNFLLPGARTLVVKAFLSSACTIDIPLEEMTVYSQPVPIIEKNDNDLTTSLDSGDTYQWYLDGELIIGANQKTFVPELTGSYSLGISLDGCDGISEPFLYEALNLKKIEESSIYPNPVIDRVTIKMHATGDYQYQVIDLTGRVLLSGETGHQKEFIIDLSKARSGLYYIRIFSGEGSVSRKIMKM